MMKYGKRFTKKTRVLKKGVENNMFASSSAIFGGQEPELRTSAGTLVCVCGGSAHPRGAAGENADVPPPVTDSDIVENKRVRDVVGILFPAAQAGAGAPHDEEDGAGAPHDEEDGEDGEDGEADTQGMSTQTEGLPAATQTEGLPPAPAQGADTPAPAPTPTPAAMHDLVAFWATKPALFTPGDVSLTGRRQYPNNSAAHRTARTALHTKVLSLADEVASTVRSGRMTRSRANFSLEAWIDACEMPEATSLPPVIAAFVRDPIVRQETPTEPPKTPYRVSIARLINRVLNTEATVHFSPGQMPLQHLYAHISHNSQRGHWSPEALAWATQEGAQQAACSYSITRSDVSASLPVALFSFSCLGGTKREM